MPQPRTMSARTALVLVLALAGAAAAQDSQYWTQQYGNQARLLGGTVVGGTDDLSATYYNPGRLALLATPRLLLAGNVFEYTSVAVDGVLDGRTSKDARLNHAPSLIAGLFGRPADGGSTFAYSVLGRQFADFRFDERRDLTAVVGFPSDLTAGAVSFDNTLSEYWAGLTWSRPLGDHVGLGVTGYVTIRNQRSRRLAVAQSALADRAALAVQRRDFEYSHWGCLAKVGLGADLGVWQLGLTATTPALKLWGSGNLGYDESLVSQDVDGDGTGAAQIITDLQTGLPAELRWAPSLAVGVSRAWGATKVHGSCEWFAGIPAYTVLDAAPTTSADGSLVRETDLRDRRAAVFNFGVGVEHVFRPGLGGYASFRTDFSSTPDNRDSHITFSIWDLYHLAGGATFRAFGSDFTLGAIYAFGSATSAAETGLVPEPGRTDGGGGPDLRWRFRRLTGLIGFAFGL